MIQNSDLSAKQVYHGLTVLIQQHLVLHHTPAASPSFYQVDWDGAYNLVRSGKIVSTVDARVGLKAATVMSSLLQLGHARVSDLEQAFRFEEQLTNGTHSTVDVDEFHEPETGRIRSKEELHNVLWHLLQARFISKVHSRTYLAPADKQNEVEELVKENEFPSGKTTGPKAKLAFENAVVIQKRKWQEEEQDVSAFVQHKAKRAKANGHLPNGTHHNSTSDVVLGGDLVLRVNFDRCVTAMRSDRLVQVAQKHLGDTTSRVYEAFLHVVERQIVTSRSAGLIKSVEMDDVDLTDVYTATTMDVLDYLEQDSDALEALGLESGLTNGDHDEEPRPKKPRLDANSIKSRNNTLHELETHLRLLTEHEFAFLERLSTRGNGEYTAPFSTLTSTLRDLETEANIANFHGTVAARMIRLLKQKGKLDEKQICTLALLKVKDVRSVLDNMHEAGLVESQEVPKDTTRQPSRAVYLWSFDQRRVERLLLDRSYTAMARCLQRVATQRAAVKGVIDKAERTDVVGHEDEFLTKADKMHLRAWREQEEKLLAQVARLDDGVAILRDF